MLRAAGSICRATGETFAGVSDETHKLIDYTVIPFRCLNLATDGGTHFSVEIGYIRQGCKGFRLALPTGAYCTWKGSVLGGRQIEQDRAIDFDWRDRRLGSDRQLDFAVECSSNLFSAKAS